MSQSPKISARTHAKIYFMPEYQRRREKKNLGKKHFVPHHAYPRMAAFDGGPGGCDPRLWVAYELFSAVPVHARVYAMPISCRQTPGETAEGLEFVENLPAPARNGISTA